ncbi:MAG: AI-2E family transporter [Tepidiformaceae bacterium]
MLKVEVSYRGLIVVGLAVLSLWALVQLWPVLLLVITAFIFMTALLPYVEWLCRRGMPRVGAVLLMVLGVLAIVGGLLSIVVPAVVDEFRDLKQNLPEDAQKLEEFAANLGFETENWGLKERAHDIDWGSFVSGRAAVNYGQKVVFGIFSAFTVIVLAAYLLVDTPRLNAFLYRFVPPGREPEVEHFLQAMNRVVGGYVRGQVITSLAIAIYTMTVLLILGVPNAVAFGVLAGFADIIPLVGALISIVPTTLAAFQESPTKGLIVLGALLAYQQFEDRFLVPRIYGQTLNLPALVVLLAVLVGGELLGIPGILLALPAAAAGRVLLDYYLDRRNPGASTMGGSPAEILAPDSKVPEA